MLDRVFSVLNSQLFYNAVIAIATVAYTVGTFVLVSESRKQRKALLRPQIDMFAEPLGGLVFYATIQNVGNNPARNIRFKFSTGTKDEIKTKCMQEIVDRFSSLHVPHLSPGKKMRYLIRAGDKDFDVDQAITVSLTFYDVEDSVYTTNVDWNMSRLKGSITNDEMRDFYKKIPENLKNINNNLTKIVNKLQKLK